MTPADLGVIRALDIRTACDLRSEGERLLKTQRGYEPGTDLIDTSMGVSPAYLHGRRCRDGDQPVKPVPAQSDRA